MYIKKKQVKLFHGTAEEVEQQANEWLSGAADNHYDILYLRIASHKEKSTLMIIYLDKI